MEVSTAQEWQFFLWSLLAGGILALFYDFLRISRRLIPTKDVIVNAEDISFCIFAALVLFAAAFLKNEGKIRWQGFIGAFSGFAVYRLIVRNFVVNSGVFLVSKLMRVLFFLLKIILFPVMLICKILRKPFALVAWYSRRGVHRAAAAARVRGGRFHQRWRSTKNSITKK